MKRIISLLLVFVMVLGLLVGCGGPSEDPADQTLPHSADNTDKPKGTPSTLPTLIREDPKDLEWMDDVSPITFTVFHNNVELADWQWGNDPVTQYITERTGVTLNYEFAPDAENNRLTLMLADGDELPDFISYVGGGSQIVNEMVKGDYIYAMNELIDTYCPKMYDLMYEEEYTTAANEDGNFYVLSNSYVGTEMISSPYSITNGQIGIRTDIMRDLGYEMEDLKTQEDLMNFLADFKANWSKYPEIKYPVLIGPQAIGIGTYTGMYGEACTLGFYYDKETDTIMNWYEREAGKEQLKFLNQMYKEGYILPEALTIARADYAGLLQAGTALILMKDNVWETAAANAGLATSLPDKNAEMSPIGPITVDENTQWKLFVAAGNPVNMPQGIVITKDCKDPERAIKFLEFLRTEEANLTIMCGVYGKDFEIATDENGVSYPQPIGDAAACGGDYEALSQMGIYNYNRTWLCVDGVYDQASVYSANFSEDLKDISAGRTLWNETLDPTVISAATGLVDFPNGSTLATLYPNVKSIRENFISKIVLSNTDDEFETYYQQLITESKKAGSDEMVQIMLPLLHEQLKLRDPDGTFFK